MPKYIPNTRLSDCWSSVGNITFYHRDGKCYWRSKPAPVFPGTMKQMEHQQVHLRALAAWRTLDQNTQLQWRRRAMGVTAHRPPFLGEGSISGHNLFVSAYHGFATLGNEHVPTRSAFKEFPGYRMEFVSAEVTYETCLLLRFSLDLGGFEDVLRYRCLGRFSSLREGKDAIRGRCGIFFHQRQLLLRRIRALLNSGFRSICLSLVGCSFRSALVTSGISFLILLLGIGIYIISYLVHFLYSCVFT